MTRRPNTHGSTRARPKPTSKPGGAKPSRSAGRRPVSAEVKLDDPRPPRQITVRTLVLAIVLLMAFVLITPTLRAYIRQQEEIRELSAQLREAQETSEELDDAIRRWNSDEYVRSQARDRLGFVMPGETPYRVLDPETVVGDEPEPEAEIVSSIVVGTGPWYVDVWESVLVAGEMEP